MAYRDLTKAQKKQRRQYAKEYYARTHPTSKAHRAFEASEASRIPTQIHNQETRNEIERTHDTHDSLHFPSFSVGVAFSHCATWLENYSRSTQIPLPVLTNSVSELLRAQADGEVLGAVDSMSSPRLRSAATQGAEIRVPAVEMAHTPRGHRTYGKAKTGASRQSTIAKPAAAHGYWRNIILRVINRSGETTRTDLNRLLKKRYQATNAQADNAIRNAIISNKIVAKGELLVPANGQTIKPRTNQRTNRRTPTATRSRISQAMRNTWAKNTERWQEALIKAAKELKEQNQPITKANLRTASNKIMRKPLTNTTPYQHMNRLIEGGILKPQDREGEYSLQSSAEIMT